IPDLAIVNLNDNSVSVLLNMTGRGFVVPSFSARFTFSTGIGPSAIAFGDFQLDGRPDLVIANRTDNSIQVLTNQSPLSGFALQFTETDITVGIGTANPDSVAVADF